MRTFQKTLALFGLGLVAFLLAPFCALADGSFAEGYSSPATCGGSQEISISAPEDWQVGDTGVCVIRFRALNRYSSSSMVHPIASGLECLGTQPAASRDGGNLVWSMGAVEAGEERVFQVQYKATGDARTKFCAFLQAVSCACTEAKTVRAKIAVEKRGPASAVIGDDVNFAIAVSNQGDGIARNVRLVDVLPDGLRHSSGSGELSMEIGDLAPGEVRNLSMVCKAVTRGRQCNKAMVSSLNGGQAESTACVDVLERQLNLVKDGPKTQFLGRKATYSITVSNPGDAPVTGVQVVDTLPPQYQFVSASAGGRSNGQQIVWELGRLEGGQSANLAVTVTCVTPGTFVNNVAASCNEGLRREASAATLWRGMPAVRLEVVDDPDPVEIGGSTIYTISVMNQGTARDANVQVTAVFPDSLRPLAVSGALNSTITGQKVVFAPVAIIEPKQEIIYKIKAQAVSVDDARLKVYVKTDLLETPVYEEESTHLY